MIFSVANQKGGVGKTTTVINVGYYLEHVLNQRVLYVDLDPQKSFTTYTFHEDGIELPREISRRMGDANTLALFEEEFEGIPYRLSDRSAIFGATDHLTLASTCTDEQVDFFRANLLSVAKDFDHVILDCPPSIGQQQYSAFCASDYIIIPTTVDRMSTEGIHKLYEVTRRAKHNKNRDLKILGVYLNSAKKESTQIQKAVWGDLEELCGNDLMETQIFETVKVREANYLHQAIMEYDPKSAEHIQVTAFIEELLQRAGIEAGERK